MGVRGKVLKFKCNFDNLVKIKDPPKCIERINILCLNCAVVQWIEPFCIRDNMRIRKVQIFFNRGNTHVSKLCS